VSRGASFENFEPDIIREYERLVKRGARRTSIINYLAEAWGTTPNDIRRIVKEVNPDA
jgi:hypothetical protein